MNLFSAHPYIHVFQGKNRPFDMGSYGEQILDTISSRTDSTGTASFGEIVCGRPKYEVVRTFSALLQLVNFCFFPQFRKCNPEHFLDSWLLQVNGRSVDLDKGQSTNELVCYTAENPFHARLIGLNQRGQKWRHALLRRELKSPLQNAGKGGESSLAQHECPKQPLHKNGKIPVKTGIRLTADGKRRLRSASHGLT
jgi:condensin-2 complex subunit H2